MKVLLRKKQLLLGIILVVLIQTSLSQVFENQLITSTHGEKADFILRKTNPTDLTAYFSNGLENNIINKNGEKTGTFYGIETGTDDPLNTTFPYFFTGEYIVSKVNSYLRYCSISSDGECNQIELLSGNLAYLANSNLYRFSEFTDSSGNINLLVIFLPPDCTTTFAFATINVKTSKIISKIDKLSTYATSNLPKTTQIYNLDIVGLFEGSTNYIYSFVLYNNPSTQNPEHTYYIQYSFTASSTEFSQKDSLGVRISYSTQISLTHSSKFQNNKYPYICQNNKYLQNRQKGTRFVCYRIYDHEFATATNEYKYFGGYPENLDFYLGQFTDDFKVVVKQNPFELNYYELQIYVFLMKKNDYLIVGSCFINIDQNRFPEGSQFHAVAEDFSLFIVGSRYNEEIKKYEYYYDRFYFGFYKINTIISTYTNKWPEELLHDFTHLFRFYYDEDKYSNYALSSYNGKSLELCTDDPSSIVNCLDSCPTGKYRKELSNKDYLCYQKTDLPNWELRDDGYFYECTVYHYTDSSGNTKCTYKCSDPYLYLDEANKECLTDCPYNYYQESYSYYCINECKGSNYPNNNFNSKECTKSCKDGYYFIKNDNTYCTSTCSSKSGYDIFSYNSYQCLSNCDTKYYYEDSNKYCVENCETYSKYNKNNYSNEKECLSVCPSYFYVDDSNKIYCVNNCNENTDYNFALNDGTKKCVAECPSKYYTDNNINYCTNTCSYSPYLNNDFRDPKQCFSNCSKYYFIEDDKKTCNIDNCSDTNYQNINDKQCTSSCEDKYYIVGTTQNCEDNCEDISIGYNYNKYGTDECINSCEYLYIDKSSNPNKKYCADSCAVMNKKNQYNSTNPGICLDDCVGTYSKYFTENNAIYCVESCEKTDNKYKYNQLNSSECLSKFTDKFYIDDSKRYFSLKECKESSTYKYDLNNGTNECVKDCGDGYKYYEDKGNLYCTSDCESLSVYNKENGDECLSKCPYFFYQTVNNETNSTQIKCIQTCKDQEVYYYDSNIGSYECLSKCPSKFYESKDGFFCTSTCESSGFKNNLKDSDECLESCDKYFYKEKNDNNNLYCTNACNESSPYIYSLNDNSFECVDKCPNKYYKSDAKGADEYFCLTQCEGEYKYNQLDSSECLTECPSKYYIDNSKYYCIDSCSLNAIYNKDANDNSNMCLDKCPAKYYIDNNENYFCLSQCEKSTEYYKNLKGTDECLSECPKKFYTDKQNDSKVFCIDTCAGESIYFKDLNNNTDECVDTCPIKEYTNNKNETYCLSQCEDSEIYNKNVLKDETKCLSKCPKYSYKDSDNKIFCIDSCKEGGIYKYDSNDGLYQCLSECPFKYYKTENDDYICSTTCNVDPYTYFKYNDNECLTSCKDFFYIEEGKTFCIGNCTDNPAYNSVDGKQCKSQCPNKYFINTTVTCVKTCEDDTAKTAKYNINKYGSSQCLNDCNLYNYVDKDGKKYCLNSCGEMGKKTIFGTKECTDECPNKFYTDRSTKEIYCVDNCEVTNGNYKYENFSDTECLYEYVSRYYVVEVDNSPEPRGLEDDQEANITYYYHAIPACILDSKYKFDKNDGSDLCVEQCDNNYYEDENGNLLCVDNCEGEYNKHSMDSTECIKECPDRFYIDQNEEYFCVNECLNAGNYFYDANNNSSQCIEECPERFYKDDNDNNYYCVNNCDEAINHTNIELFGKECFTTCPNMFYIDEIGKVYCLDDCQLSLVYNQVNDTNPNQCISECQEKYYLDENDDIHCTKSCEDELIYNINKYQFNECLKNCTGKTFTGTDNKIYCADSCEIVGKISIYNSNECADNCTNKYFIDNETNLMYCVDSCEETNGEYKYNLLNDSQCLHNYINKFYFDSKKNKYFSVNECGENPDYLFDKNYDSNECVQKCEIKFYTNEKDNSSFCLDKCSDSDEYNKALENSNECVNVCPNKFYKDLSENETYCINDCKDHSIYDKISYLDNQECLKECMFYKDENDNKICVETCPSSYLPNDDNTECISYCENLEETDSKLDCTSKLDYNNFLNLFTKIIGDSIYNNVKDDVSKKNDKVTVVKFNNDTGVNYSYLFYAFDTSNPNINSNKIDISKCISKLQTKYSLSKDEKIYIAHTLVSNDNSASGEYTQYELFDSKGNQLDKSICFTDSGTITITKEINNQTLKNYSLFQSLYTSKGINIFNEEEELFHDPCLGYADETTKKDMTVENRREKIYQDYKLCEDGCKFSSVDFESNEVKCECSENQESTNIGGKIEKKITVFNETSSANNFFMFGCIQRFSLEEMKKNTAFVTGVVVMASDLACFVASLTFGISKIFGFTTSQFIHSPPIRKKKKTESSEDSDDDDEDEEESQEKSENDKKDKGDMKISIYTQRSQLDSKCTTGRAFDMDNIKTKGFTLNNNTNVINENTANQYTLEYFCKFIFNCYVETDLILMVFNTRLFYKEFMTFFTRLMTLFFYIHVLLFFNALFVTPSSISKRYNSIQTLNLSYIMSKEIVDVILTVVIAIFATKFILFVCLKTLNKNMDEILKRKDVNIKRNLKIRLSILFGIYFVFSFLFLYFTTIFYAINKKASKNIIPEIAFDIFVEIFFELFVSLLFGSLKFLGLKNKNK